MLAMWIFFSLCFLHGISSQEATMTCSRTSDTFQLASTLPSAVGPASSASKPGKRGPKGQKGEMGLKGAKGEAPPADRSSRDQVAGKLCKQLFSYSFLHNYSLR